MNELPRTAPEAQGASSTGIRAFLDGLDELDGLGLGGVHSVMVLKSGSVIAETWWQPYASETQHMLFSLSKSFTSIAVGLAIEEGLLTLDARVIDLLPGHTPAEPSENLAAMTVRHLLTMTTGHAADTLDRLRRDEPSWVRAILAEPVDLAPGSQFVYNSGATYLLSAIMQRVSGQRLLDYLTPRLLEPLQIAGARWQQSPDGIDAGGFGLRLRTEDIAKFGQLLLQHGEWNGTQLVPAAWVAEATASQVACDGDSVDWQSGYGYQFWQNRDGSYRADGAFGQFCLVLDDADAVVVITAALTTTKAALDLVFERLVPALSADPAPAPTLASADAPTELITSRLIPTPNVSAREYAQKFFFPTNPLTITDVAIAGSVLTGSVLTIDEFSIPFGEREWVTGGEYRVDGAIEPVAASGGWIDETHFVVQVRAVETPYVFDLTITLEGDTVDLRVTQNVSFAPRMAWRLVGGIASGD